MVNIGTDNRIDWNAIRAEYIGSKISQRKLAAKYGLKYPQIRNKAEIEGWVKLREEAERKSSAQATQKVADAAADNAVIAADIKKRLLLRLQRIEQKYPFDATEVRSRNDKNVVIYRIRDLTAAYRDLTDDMPKVEADKNAPIYELLRRLDDECI